MLFALREVTYRRGGRVILPALTVALEEGMTALVGPSGAGKSTLLRLLNRLADPDGGTIHYRGRDVRDYDVLELRLTRNSGAAFSVGTGSTWLFTAVAVLVALVLVRTAARLHSRAWAVALGLLLGGALGNLVDRFVRAPGPGRGRGKGLRAVAVLVRPQVDRLLKSPRCL